MNESHKKRLRSKHDKSQVAYWRERAEKAERELAELRALHEGKRRYVLIIPQTTGVSMSDARCLADDNWETDPYGVVTCNGVTA